VVPAVQGLPAPGATVLLGEHVVGELWFPAFDGASGEVVALLVRALADREVVEGPLSAPANSRPYLSGDLVDVADPREFVGATGRQAVTDDGLYLRPRRRLDECLVDTPG